jgi:hypothetical protein
VESEGSPSRDGAALNALRLALRHADRSIRPVEAIVLVLVPATLW